MRTQARNAAGNAGETDNFPRDVAGARIARQEL